MDTAHHIDAQRPDTHGADDTPEGDACTWKSGGSWSTPPDHCDIDAVPGEEHCAKHLKQEEAQREWETEVGLDNA